jgi:DNA mismatch endonuclease, patch repair protein
MGGRQIPARTEEDPGVVRSMGTKVPRPPPPSSAATTVVMRANRAQDTSPELAIRRALWALGVKGYRVAPRGIPGRPDIAFVGRRLAVFVNGCFWHQHGCARSGKAVPKSNRNYWETKFKLNRERDRRKVRQLQSMGWRVLTIWECDVDSNPEKCARQVVSRLGLEP